LSNSGQDHEDNFSKACKEHFYLKKCNAIGLNAHCIKSACVTTEELYPKPAYDADINKRSNSRKIRKVTKKKTSMGHLSLYLNIVSFIVATLLYITLGMGLLSSKIYWTYHVAYLRNFYVCE
jgi:hypothetical protein